MQRLSGMDASFLYLETPTTHMHVVGALILDPSNLKGGWSFDRMRNLIESRLHLVPQFRWRLVEVPLNLERPLWVDDPNFALDRHLKHSTLPAPGSMHELADLVGKIASVPLDRESPLWKMWVVEGLANGNVALVSKMHHAGIDGISGADLMAHLFDFESDAPEPEPPEGELPVEPTPSNATLIRDALVSQARDPLRWSRAVARTGRSMFNMARGAVGLQPQGRLRPALPFTAPRTKFNQTITASRVVAFGQAELEDLRFIKSTFGTTVNDVVLAACAITLRRYLEAHDDLPDKPLLCSVPVSVHGQGKSEGINQVSNMFVRLPIHIDDPADQLLAIHEETKDAKEVFHAMGADMIQDLAQITPPGVFNLAARVYSSTRMADQLPPIQNLIISNVPGPPVPLYIAGARAVGIFPFGPLLEGTGINITVLSNMGNMDFGVIACGDTVPDVWDIAEGFGTAVDELRVAADKAAKAAPSAASKATARKAPAKKKPAKKKATGTKAAKAPARTPAAPRKTNTKKKLAARRPPAQTTKDAPRRKTLPPGYGA